MEKVHKICNFFWKKSFIFIPVLLIGFYIYGYSREYLYLKEMQDIVVNHSEENPKEYIELLVMIYDNFSDEYIESSSFTCGVVNGIVYTLAILYIVFLISLIVSDKEKWRVLGIIILFFTILAILLYIYFIMNLKIPF